jgi:hypothetical protein
MKDVCVCVCCGWKGREMHAGFWWETANTGHGRMILK